MKKLLDYYTRTELGAIFNVRPSDFMKRKTLSMEELEKLPRIWAEPQPKPEPKPKKKPKFSPDPIDPRLAHLRVYTTDDFIMLRNLKTKKTHKFWNYFTLPKDEADTWRALQEYAEWIRNPKYMNCGVPLDSQDWEWVNGERKKFQAMADRYHAAIGDPELILYLRETYPPRPWTRPGAEKTNEYWRE